MNQISIEESRGSGKTIWKKWELIKSVDIKISRTFLQIANLFFSFFLLLNVSFLSRVCFKRDVTHSDSQSVGLLISAATLYLKEFRLTSEENKKFKFCRRKFSFRTSSIFHSIIGRVVRKHKSAMEVCFIHF